MSRPHALLLSLLALLATACGGRQERAAPAPAVVEVPGVPWARVAPAQVEAAAAAGVPAAFENEWGMRFVFVPAGRFAMGSPDDEAGHREGETRHQVDIGRGFFLQVAPVDMAALTAFGPTTEFEIPFLPEPSVALVPHAQALAIAAALSARDATWDYRLPTEAEWEYACRAGTTSRFAWGDGAAPTDPAAYVNPWGVRGMHAGPAEWCSDRYAPLPSWTLSDHGGPNEGSGIVTRGGAAADAPARSAQRASADPADLDTRLAVRLAVPLGYGLGRYGSTPVTFRLVDEKAKPGSAAPTGGYDLRVISMNDRLAARTHGVETVWRRVPDPGSPVTLTMVPGAYYVYAERTVDGTVLRGKEMKFYVAGEALERTVPIPEKDLRAYGSGAREKPQ